MGKQAYRGKGDIIFFMHNNKIEKKPILGISTYVGDCQVLMGNNRTVPEGEVLIVYHTGSYQEVELKDAYDNLDDLMKSLLKPVVGKEGGIKEELPDTTA